MHFRRWDGLEPATTDECRIPASAGAEVVPDVVLAPCVGFTVSGYRIGYGGGYFDRWLAAHPQATAIGVAWSANEIDEAELAPRAHDIALMLVVTEEGVVTR
jgi:5-formyltetrahydrofolate cyclo-ligase